MAFMETMIGPGGCHVAARDCSKPGDQGAVPAQRHAKDLDSWLGLVALVPVRVSVRGPDFG